jgi:hypothetical protein
MTFSELQNASRDIATAQIEPSLFQLMRDSRFPALLRILSDHKEALVTGVCAPQVAGRPEAASVMAHGLGGYDAMLNIEARLMGIWESQTHGGEVSRGRE